MMIIKLIQEKVSLVELNAKKNFLNLAEKLKFTFHCQNQVFALQDGMVTHQAAQLK